MKEGNNKVNKLNIIHILTVLLSSKRKIFIASCIGAVVGLIIGFTTPKIYNVKVTLSPEISMRSGVGSLGSMASMLGMGGLGNTERDAVRASMFPEIIRSNPFIIEMLQINMVNRKGEDMILYDYLDTEKSSLVSKIIGFIPNTIGKIISLVMPKKEDNESDELVFDSFRLSKKQATKIVALRKRMAVKFDKKTYITNISVALQDPVAAAIVADSALSKLQKYMIEYKTNKARNDYEYQEKMCIYYKEKFDKAQKEYDACADANKNISSQGAKSRLMNLKRNADLSYQLYSQVMMSKQIAESKLQEAKPAFAILEPPTIPVQASKPSKLITLITFVFLATCIEIVWLIFGEEILNKLKPIFKKE